MGCCSHVTLVHPRTGPFANERWHGTVSSLRFGLGLGGYILTMNCLELPADEHFVWDVLWQGLKPDVFSIVYGPTKVVP
jgi:hypothetical protein